MLPAGTSPPQAPTSLRAIHLPRSPPGRPQLGHKHPIRFKLQPWARATWGSAATRVTSRLDFGRPSLQRCATPRAAPTHRVRPVPSYTGNVGNHTRSPPTFRFEHNRSAATVDPWRTPSTYGDDALGTFDTVGLIHAPQKARSAPKKCGMPPKHESFWRRNRSMRSPRWSISRRSRTDHLAESRRLSGTTKTSWGCRRRTVRERPHGTPRRSRQHSSPLPTTRIHDHGQVDIA